MILRPCAAREFSPPSGKKLHDVDHVIHVKKTERGRQPQDLDQSKEKEIPRKRSKVPATGIRRFELPVQNRSQVLASDCETLILPKKKVGYQFSEGKKGEGQ